MNWDQVKGGVKQAGAQLKQKWAKLTDDDLKLLDGKREEFLARLQQRYGYEKEKAETELDGFLKSFDTRGTNPH